MGGLIQRGGGLGGLSPLLAACTKYNSPFPPSTASVPTSYYLMWHYNSKVLIILLTASRVFELGKRRVKLEAMSPWRCGVLPAVVVVLAVAASLAAGQQHSVRGHQVVSGQTHRETYETSYVRETARHRADELVPQVVKINIKRQEQTRA